MNCKRNRVRHRVYALLAVALAFIYGSAIVGMQERQRLTIDAAYSQGLGLARALSEHLLQVARGAQMVHDQVGELLRERGFDGVASPDGRAYMAGLIRRFPEISFVSVLTGDGTLVANSHYPIPGNANYSYREYFERHAAGEDFVISAPIISARTGAWVFTISRMFRDASGRPEAIVVVAIEQNRLVRLMKDIGAVDRVTVVRSDGVILARTLETPPGQKLPPSAKLFQEVKEHDAGSYQAQSPIDGESLLISYAKTGNLPIYVTVADSRNRVLANWYDDIIIGVLILLASTVALLGGAFVILNAFAREEHAREQMAENHRLRDAVLDSMPTHVAILGPDGTILSTNRAWKSFAGGNGLSGTPGVVGANYLEICRSSGAEDGLRAATGIEAVMNGTTPDFHYDYACHSPEEHRWHTMKVTPLATESGAVLVSHENVSRLKAAEAVLRERAETDALTGLANRRRFFEYGEHQFALARRHGNPLAVVILDCDRFKAVNDTLGHDAGDLVLVSLAATVSKCLRKTDLVARIGGEEFAVLLPETPLDGALIVAEEIRTKVAATQVASPAGDIAITVSLGVATSMTDTADFSQLMREADQALYAAKNGGRDRVVAFGVTGTAPPRGRNEASA